MRKLALSVSSLALLSGCARLPPVDFNYLPAKGNTAVSVVQTFDCSTDSKRLVVVTTPATVTTQYSADRETGPWTLEISRTRGEGADTDFTINYYVDGRLKSINAVSTGQGEAILKSAISLVGAALPLVGGAGRSDPGAPVLPECATITNWGKGKPVTLTFAGVVDLAARAGGPPQNLMVTPDGQALFGQLSPHGRVVLPQTRLTLVGAPIIPAISRTADPSGYVPLKLQKVYPSTLDITLSGTKIWSGNVLVPKPEPYELPIPKAALFGKTTVVVNVDESGAVTSIQYGRQTGAAGALNVLTAAATEAAPDSAATKAAATKAQADLIAQSQRLARCQAQPDQCQ